MNKLYILLILFIVTLLSGCGSVSNPDLNNHINTMNSLNTYVIKVESVKHDLTNDSIIDSYVYIDNVHGTYLVTDEEKTNMVVKKGDIMFEYLEDTLYSYVFEGVWAKYEINLNHLNIKNFESVLFSFFENPVIKRENNSVEYTSYININDLEGSLYNILGENFTQKYRDEDFALKAYYDNDLKRFTSFTFDLSEIYKSEMKDNGVFSSDETSWMINFSFENINEEFSILLNQYQLDDYYNSFAQLDILNITSNFSFDMIKGNLDYQDDQDILQIEFEVTSLYRILLKDISTTAKIRIEILDSNYNFIKEEYLSSVSLQSKYFSFSKGIYYIIISSVGEQFEETAYKFLFLGN